MTSSEKTWALALFNKSVLKKEKYRQISSLLGETDGRTCLDIGADNGIISLLLREKGGQWFSADLEETAVKSIEDLVGRNVYQIDGEKTPFQDRMFDTVIIVDFLEHIHTDREFIRELKRILKPGGELIINVPHLKRYSLLNGLRKAIGLTDEKHGHVRPGYSLEGLMSTLGPDFRMLTSRTYSRAFSESIDIVLNCLYEILQKVKKRRTGSKKGTVITQADMEKNKKEFALLAVMYPFLWLLSKMDRILFLQQGYKLIMKASLNSHKGVF